MRTFRENVWIPLALFLVMLIDGQLSTFLANVLPLNWHLVSHLLLVMMLFTSLELLDLTSFFVFIIIGIFYDSYYFHIIGIATLLLPLLSLSVNKFNAVMMANRVTRLMSVLLLVFLFEFVSFILASLLNLVNMSMGIFIVYSLAPSMLLNLLLVLLLQPLLERVYL